MADTVTSKVLASTTDARKYAIHLTCISDGTGETNVVKVDRSALVVFGTAPMSIKIASIRWNIQGFSYIKLSWDHAADDTAVVMNGNGYEDFEPFGSLLDPNTSGDTVTGAIGDILLSSVGAVAGATYDITLEVILSL